MRRGRNWLSFVASITAGILATHTSSAQVDWGELFPDEGAPKKPAPAVKPQEPADPPKPVAAPKAQPPVAVKPVVPPKVQPPVAVKPVAPAVVAPAPAKVAPQAPPKAVVERENAPTDEEAPPPAEAVPQEVKPARPVRAQIAPSGDQPKLADLGLSDGDRITDKNIEQYKDFVSPGIEWGVRNGWRLSVTETRPIRPFRAYREATEKYSGQVRLGADGVTLLNHTAGQPFPDIDPNDPQVAMKIMWNFYYGWAYTDDLDARLFDGDTGSIGQGRSMEVERHYIIDHLRRLYYNARLVVDPKPVFPNTEGYRFKESLHPLLEPFDLKGVGGTFYRYLDPNRQDDSWLYLPQLRRVRRLSSTQRSDALFGQDTDVDSYYGYNGAVAWNDYRYLGEKVMLVTVHARNVPVKWQDPEDWFYDDVWEPRRMHVIEAVSKLAQYAYSKRVIFIDREAYVVPYSDIYDRAGQLWKVWVNMYSFRKESVPGARLAVYDEEMAFGNAVTMMDMQLSHATRGALPSAKTRAEEGWFINMGEKSGTNEDFFTIAHLIETGH